LILHKVKRNPQNNTPNTFIFLKNISKPVKEKNDFYENEYPKKKSDIQ